MATLRASYTSGVSGLYVRATNSSGQFWYTVTPAFEAWDASHIASYAIALTEIGTSGLYSATVPASWPAGTYEITFFDPAVSSSPLASDVFSWDGTDESTPANMISGLLSIQTQIVNSFNATEAHFDAEIAALQAHGDSNWVGDGGGGGGVVPVYVQIGTGEVLWNEIKAYQFSAFGPFTFQLYDSQKPPEPVDVSGNSITFICYDKDGTHLWQIEDCLVLGTYSNLVKVEQDDTNTADAGNFKYVLRDTTDDKVLATGRLIIEVAADAE
jgi:hypothetical protein